MTKKDKELTQVTTAKFRVSVPAGYKPKSYWS